MKNKAFRYEFSGKELSYFMFKKKKCPKCGGKMIKNKCSKIVDGKIFDSPLTPLYISGRSEVKQYYYSFTCEKCGAEYTLSELAKK